ncbi:S8 family serine peptidase, partial [Candidatus Margulisiibacteriota bacterium]
GQLVEVYRNNPLVEIVEPNFIRYPLVTIPNDVYFSLQWGLSNINAPLGWGIERGDNSVIIAVLDTGIDFDHPDLTNKYWINSGEIYGDGYDNDENGYDDDRFGWDFIDDDALPWDLNGHGTHVSGIAAAESNNNVGIAGVSWNCSVMPVRVLSTSGGGPLLAELLGIYYAADNGADVINLSLGSSSESSLENDAIQYARDMGCVIIAAAGNNGDSSDHYPASCNNVISVGAVDQNDNKSSYSNYNSMVDVCAPGGEENVLHDPDAILSTLPTYSYYIRTLYGYYYDYDFFQGTSMAAPFVSGMAALIFSQNPTWPNTQVENRIFSSVDDLGDAGRDDYYGYGRINLLKALNDPPATPLVFAANSGKTRIILSWATNTEPDLDGYNIYRSSEEAGPYTLITSLGASAISYVDETSEGTYYYKIAAYDMYGFESSLSDAISASVDAALPSILLNVYPNPFTIGSSGGVAFAGFNGDERINIYTIAGELVISRQLVGEAVWTWDTLNTAGRQVAPGIYIYMVRSPAGEKTVGKIAIK